MMATSTLVAESWEERAANKRANILEQIPDEWRLNATDLERASKQLDLTGRFIQSLLTRETVEITSLDTVDIVAALQGQEYSAVQVVTAFCHSAAVSNQINSCLHEVFFAQALGRAKELDDNFAKYGRPVGPLHGLPVSLKDQFHVKNVDTTMGYVGWIGENLGVSPEETHRTESQVVTELLSLGAVLYCKTSLPQTLLYRLGETINNIIGRTMNPHNMGLSCGGSSGGEGALLALRGSSVGFGTDIGGSVRIPAAFCAVFSIKPTPERLSYRNVANTNPGQNTYRSTVGLMSTSLGGLELVFRSVLSTKPWVRDPAVVPIPWRQHILDFISSRVGPGGTAKEQPLKLGILWRNDSVEPHPPVRRGLKMVAEAVRQAGHSVVDWVPPKQSTAKRVHVSFLFADGAHDVHSHLNRSGEPLVPELQESFQLREAIPLLEYQDLTIQGLAYENEYSDYWNSRGGLNAGDLVDAVIMPVAPHAAVIPGKYYHTAYTEAINLLNYSAVVIPVTKANKDLDPIDSTYEPISVEDKKNWEAYNPDVYHGGPVGVQIVARKFEEEKALAIAKVVHAALGNYTSLIGG